MIRNLITLLFLFLVGWVIYTQVLGRGSAEEKELSDDLVDNAKNVVSSIGSILGNETKKFKDGTYDDAIDEVGGLLDKLRAKTSDKGLQAELDKLKEEEQRIKREIAEVKNEENSARPAKNPAIHEKETKEDIRKLTEDIQRVVEVMKNQNK